MHLRPLSTLAVSLLLAACATAPQATSGTAYRYHCESGQDVSASYPDTETAIVTIAGQQHRMAIAVSASGSRYVGDGLEWWTKGSGSGAEATLFQHAADGTTGDRIDLCTAR